MNDDEVIKATISGLLRHVEEGFYQVRDTRRAMNEDQSDSNRKEDAMAVAVLGRTCAVVAAGLNEAAGRAAVESFMAGLANIVRSQGFVYTNPAILFDELMAALDASGSIRSAGNRPS